MERNMDFFMTEVLDERNEVEIPGVSKFKYPKGHELEGQVIPWLLKSVTTEEFSRITSDNTTLRKNRKTKKMEKHIDEERLTTDLMVETIVYPDFKDKAWLNKEKLIDPNDLLMKVLSLPGDFKRISNEVCFVNGIGVEEDDDEMELVNEAKN